MIEKDAINTAKQVIGFKAIGNAIDILNSFPSYLDDCRIIMTKSFDIIDAPIYLSMFNRPVNDQKQYLIDFVIDEVQKQYPSLILNRPRLIRFANLLHPFGMKIFFDFIHETYSDPELVTVEQLQEFILRNMYIKDDKNILACLEFDVNLSKNTIDRYINTIARFAQITISGTNPIETTRFDNVEVGEVYINNELKYIKVFKKGVLRVRFESEQVKNIFKEALGKEPAEIIGRSNQEQPAVPLGICDICMFKNYKCESCENFSQWVGDCKYCCTYKRQFVSTANCEKCKTGKSNNFNLISISTTSELETFWQNNKPSWA